MADLRMLQEQSQLLQNLIGSVTDALKAVNTRLDQQAETTRKAFADQKLVIDNLTNDVRVIREKLDDNNVRIGSLTQEVESLRQLAAADGHASVRRPATPPIRRRLPQPPQARRRPRALRRTSASACRRRSCSTRRWATTTPASTISPILGFTRLHQELPQVRPRRRRAGEHLLRVRRRTARTTRRSKRATSPSAPIRTATRFPTRTTRRGSRCRT